MKIHFTYSPQYEGTLNTKEEFLSWTLIQNRIKQLNTWWEKEGKEIVDTFQKVSKLKFNKQDLMCYLNSVATLSDPLSLKIEDLVNMKDNLMHELCHVLLTQNYSKIKKGWDAQFKKYDSEDPVTIRHLAIHAIHSLVAEKLMPMRVKHVKVYSDDKRYVRSWQMVSTEGPENIINGLHKK